MPVCQNLIPNYQDNVKGIKGCPLCYSYDCWMFRNIINHCQLPTTALLMENVSNGGSREHNLCI